MELHSVEAIADAFHAVGVRYLVAGGLAVNAHGYERFTHDLDLIVALDPKNIVAAARALRELGYRPAVPATDSQLADPDVRRTWKEQRNMLVLKFDSDLHPRTSVDVFIEEPFDFSVEWERALKVPISAARDIPVLCLEGLLAMKEAAGREKDLLDIQMLHKLHHLP